MELDNNVDKVDKDEKLVMELFGIVEKIEIDNSNNNDDYSERELDNIISYEEYIEYERKKAKEPPPDESGGSEEIAALAEAAKEQPAKVISDNNNIQQSEQKINYSLLFKYGNIVKNIEERTILLNFLLDGGVNFLIGGGGVGKTYLCYHLIVALLRMNYEVFYIDIDNPSSILKERKFEDKILELNKQDNIRYYNFYDVKEALKNKDTKTLEQFILTLMSEIANYKKQNPEKNVVVFLDALQGLIRDFGVEKTSSDFMYKLRYYSELGITYIVLHHTTKANSQQFKGFTVIRDACDMMYFIKEARKDATNNIVSYVLQSEKNRYRTSPKITIKLVGNYEFNVVEDALEGIEIVALKLIYFALKDGKKLMKQELVAAVKKGTSVDIGRATTNELIDEFVKKGFLKTEKGDRKAIYFMINEENEAALKEFIDI